MGASPHKTLRTKIAQTKRSIDSIITAEKAQLKERLRTIEEQLDRKEITLAESRQLKMRAARESAQTISVKTREQSHKLSALVTPTHSRKRTLSDTLTYKAEVQKTIDSIVIETRPSRLEVLKYALVMTIFTSVGVIVK